MPGPPPISPRGVQRRRPLAGRARPDRLARRPRPAAGGRQEARSPTSSGPAACPPGGRVGVTGLRLGLAIGLWAALDRGKDRATSIAGISRRLRRAAERLGPTYIKLGQIISSGEGIFPEELVAEFRRCRDRVPPEAFADVRRVVEDDFGRPLDDVFSAFDRAAAGGRLDRPGPPRRRFARGEEVVVKVQRPAGRRASSARTCG